MALCKFYYYCYEDDCDVHDKSGVQVLGVDRLMDDGGEI